MSGEATATDLRGVDVAGPSDGEPIVFVHGVTFTRKQWVPQREDLADRFRYVALDLPGHGAEDDEEFRLDAAVERLDAVVEREADGEAAVVGLSLGGYVATEYARRYPEKVEVLVVSGSSANLVGLLETLTRIVSRVSNRATRSGLVQRAVGWLHARFVESLGLGPAAEAEIVGAGFYPRQFGLAGFELAGRDFRAAFAAFPGPALVLNGKWDLLNRLGEREHAAAAPDAVVAVLPGAGHVCNLERPDAYADAVRRFVRSPRGESLE